MPNTIVRWGETGDQVEPVDAKKDGGSNAGKPEAAEYINWLFSRLAAGANLDRREDSLLYMPLKNSLAIEQGVGSATFARSTIGTYVDRYGVVQTAAIDEARLEPKGYLAEIPSENLILRSEEFDHGSWTVIGAMTRTGGQSSPDGGSTAYLLTGTDGGTASYIFQTVTIPNDSKTHTVSIFLKEGSAAITTIWMHLTPGNLIIVNAYVTWATHSTSRGTLTELVGSGGWYRLDMQITNDSSGNTAWNFRIYPAGVDVGPTDSVIVWGIQGELLSVVSSYIATVGATASRTGDELSVTILNNLPLQASNQTILLNFNLIGHVEDAFQELLFMVGETFRRILISSSSSDNISASWGDVGISTSKSLTPGTTHRIGLRYNGIQVDLWIDGVLEGANFPSDVTDNLGSELAIGENGAGSSEAHGYISNLRIYDRALSDEEMAVA